MLQELRCLQSSMPTFEVSHKGARGRVGGKGTWKRGVEVGGGSCFKRFALLVQEFTIVEVLFRLRQQ